MNKIKVNDTVMVISGDDKGRTGKVLKLISKADNPQVLVEGINMYKRHRKASANQAAAIVDIVKPISASNVAVIDPKTKKPSKVGFQVIKNKKQRVFKQMKLKK